MGPKEYSMKIPMYCIYRSIVTTMGPSVLRKLHVANIDPFTGSPYSVGTGPGVGKNVNITWDKHRDRPSTFPFVRSNNLDDRIGDPEYLAAFHHLIMPIAYEFNPDLVILPFYLQELTIRSSSPRASTLQRATQTV